jgi:hypothetical protein
MQRAKVFTSRALGSIVLVLLLASRVSAAGVGLRWDACVADGGAIDRSFACNTNTGALFLASSFVLDQPLTGVKRVDVSLELASSSPTLPAWWDLVTCRSGAITASGVTSTACVRLPGTPGISGIIIGEHGPNTERIEIGNFTFTPSVIGTGLEYVPVALRMVVDRTIGSGSCGGCGIPVCIAVRSVSFELVLGQPPNLVLNQPLNGTDANFATWQGGGTPVVGGAVGCPAATAVRRSVWGALKALYR